MKIVKVFYYIGTAFSLLIGIWHFFVPWMFGWHSYIPSQYKNLIVSIDWVNLCFSLLLSGLSFLLILWGKKVFSGNAEAITLFGFLTFVWIFRVFIAVIIPIPLEPIAAVAYGQLAGAVIIAALLLVSLFAVIRIYKGKE